MGPLVSVIVPVYKVEQYLAKCVDSIIGQTYKNLEIILVDDGSPDNCGKICDDYAAKDARIKVIHKANAGLGEARNSGIAIATGALLMFVDSDDYLTLDAVQVLYDQMVHDDSDMAIGRYTETYDDGRMDDSYTKWMRNTVYTGRQVLEQMATDPQLFVSAWAKLYKRELFAQLRYPAIACAEDLWVFPTLVESCRKISTVSNVVYYYYQRATSIIHVYNDRSAKACLEAYLHATQCFLQYGVFASAVRWYENSILRAFMIEDAKQARLLIRKYFDRRLGGKLLMRQSMKTWMLWVSLYVPFVKSAIRWKVRDNQRRRKNA